jgi:uncharacterized membrane protein HdeD (DUF308 family)
LTKRVGRVTRLIDVPLCAECARTVQRKSGEEERLEKLGWLAAAGAGLIVLALVLMLLPAGTPFWLQAVLGLLAGGMGGTAVFHLFRRLSAHKTLPEKKAILQSARIETFSWRAATFTFTNETFRERFQEINKPLLVER